MTFKLEAVASAPIERIEIRNRLKTLETFRPFDDTALGRRIRVIWEGSEYRGRGRQTAWDGGCTLTGNSFEKVAPINFWNLDKKIAQTAPGASSSGRRSTGGFGGFDAWLADPDAGTLKIDTALVKTEIKVADIGLNDLVFANGGIKRRIRVFRMPDENTHRGARLERESHSGRRRHALHVCITQETGDLVEPDLYFQVTRFVTAV